MRQYQTPRAAALLPRLWLVSDARNDAALEAALARLPRGSGFVFRHHHLAPAERRRRFDALARCARARAHVVVVAGPVRCARAWGGDGAFGPLALLARGPATLRLVQAHDLAELGMARRSRADAIVLSPAFATRSHPGAVALGVLRWRGLAARAGGVVIALGGLDAHRAKRLSATHWAAIDGLTHGISKKQGVSAVLSP